MASESRSVSSNIILYSIRGSYEAPRPAPDPLPANHGQYLGWIGRALSAISQAVTREDEEAVIREFAPSLPVTTGGTGMVVMDKEKLLNEDFTPPITEFLSQDPVWLPKVQQMIIAAKEPSIEGLSFVPTRESLREYQTYYIEKWEGSRLQPLLSGFIQPYAGYTGTAPAIRNNQFANAEVIQSERDIESAVEEDSAERRAALTPLLRAFLQDTKTSLIGVTFRVGAVATTRLFQK